MVSIGLLTLFQPSIFNAMRSMQMIQKTFGGIKVLSVLHNNCTWKKLPQQIFVACAGEQVEMENLSTINPRVSRAQ